MLPDTSSYSGLNFDDNDPNCPLLSSEGVNYGSTHTETRGYVQYSTKENGATENRSSDLAALFKSYESDSGITTDIEGNRSVVDPALTKKREQEAEILSHDGRTCCQRSLGTSLGLLSGLTNSLVSLFAKLVKGLGTFEIAFYRYVVMIIPLSLILCKRTNPFALDLLKGHGWVLLLRALVGCGSANFKYMALKTLPIADASVILFSSPVFTTVFARIFLKEKFNWVHCVVIVVTLGGCVMVVRPTFIFGATFGTSGEIPMDPVQRLWGCLFALISSIFTAATYVSVRRLKVVDSFVVLFWTATVGMVVTAVLAGSIDGFHMTQELRDIGYVFGLGICSLISQESLTYALKLETAGMISLLRTGDIVWSFIWQIAVFREYPHYLSIIGAILVAVSVLFLSLKETSWNKAVLEKFVRFCSCRSC